MFLAAYTHTRTRWPRIFSLAAVILSQAISTGRASYLVSQSVGRFSQLLHNLACRLVYSLLVSYTRCFQLVIHSAVFALA